MLRFCAILTKIKAVGGSCVANDSLIKNPKLTSNKMLKMAPIK